MSIGNRIVGIVQLLVVVTELGEVCVKWFILLRLASAELEKDVLSADVRSGGVQAGFWCNPHLMRFSHSCEDTLYFGGTRKSNHGHSIGFLSFS